MSRLKLLLFSISSMLIYSFVQSAERAVIDTPFSISNVILTNIGNQIKELKIKNGYLQKRLAEFKSNYFSILQQEHLNATIDLFEEEQELDPYGVAILSDIERNLWFLRQTTPSSEQPNSADKQTDFKSTLLKLCNNTCVNQQKVFDKEIQDLHDDLEKQLDSLGTQFANNTKVVLVQIARNTKETQKSLEENINNSEIKLKDMGNGINKKLDQIHDSQLTKLNALSMQLKNVEYQNVPKSCVEAVKNSSHPGTYEVLLANDVKSVYCDGIGWLLIQRQLDGPLSFNRSWSDYKNGFGNPYGQYWLGLETLREILVKKRHELFITMTDFENNKTIARYDDFLIGSEDEKYELKKLGTYSGNSTTSSSAGTDRLRSHLNMKFSTYDNDNDLSKDANCATLYGSGWWHEKCFWTNLNQKVLKDPSSNLDNDKVLYWNYRSPLKEVFMFIRSKSCSKM